MADAVLVDHIVQVVLLALAVGIRFVILQHQGYLDNKICLEQVPVVVGHTIGNDVLRPFLETCLYQLLIFLDQVLDEWIHLGEFVDDVLVNHLKSCHTNKCLLMAMVQVGRHIAVGEALHIDIKHVGSHPAVPFFASGGIDASGISRQADDLPVDIGYIASRLGRRSLFHLARCPTDIGNTTLFVIVVGNKVFYLWTVKLRFCTARTIKLHSRLRGTFSSGVVELLTIHEDIRGMGLPVHLQTRVEPVGLFAHLAHHVFYLSLQLGYLQVFHLLSPGKGKRTASQQQPSCHCHV